MLDGVNDGVAEALELARLLKGSAAQGEPHSLQYFPGARSIAVRRPRSFADFAMALNAKGVIATIRAPAAMTSMRPCGQLVGRVHDRTTVRLGSKLVSVAVEA